LKGGKKKYAEGGRYSIAGGEAKNREREKKGGTFAGERRHFEKGPRKKGLKEKNLRMRWKKGEIKEGILRPSGDGKRRRRNKREGKQRPLEIRPEEKKKNNNERNSHRSIFREKSGWKGGSGGKKKQKKFLIPIFGGYFLRKEERTRGVRKKGRQLGFHFP